ncbi:MAG: diaminopimelate decarboxylase [Saprospiraceae bacterium]|nr:diaminopimelate decarboxylase [Saprospiraceae bacterium]MBP7699308.1 diaminopimelate decarboxylase [Saprospiraceae bacterium]
MREQLLAASEQFGTPLYVYDCEHIRQQYKKLKDAFIEIPLAINYACKANSNVNILKLIHDLGGGIDVVSLEELELAKIAGFPPERIHFTSNGVPFHQIIAAIKAGAHITIDNLPQLEQLGMQFGSTYPVMLRLQPNILAGGHKKISTGHKASKFGISILQRDELLKIIDTYQINIVGIHIHTGSDISETVVFKQTVSVLLEYAELISSVKTIDIGGGFKVQYHKDDHESDMENLGKIIKQELSEFENKHKRRLNLIIEPGKYLLSGAGYFLTTVSLVKKTPFITFAFVNSGFNHLIRPMMYDAYHEIENLSNPDDKALKYDVVGYICETDTFATNRKISKINTGDILCFKNAGAYGFSMASQYNSRFRPAEVMLNDGNIVLIRKPEEIEDLLRTQIIKSKI